MIVGAKIRADARFPVINPLDPPAKLTQGLKLMQLLTFSIPAPDLLVRISVLESDCHCSSTTEFGATDADSAFIHTWGHFAGRKLKVPAPLQIRPRHQARTSASDAVSCSTLESGISTENPANASDTPALETCTKAVSRAPPLLLGFPLCPPFLQGRVNDVEVWLRNPARVALGEELTFAT